MQQGSGYPGIGGYQGMPPNPTMNMALSPQQQQMMQYQNNLNQWAPTQKIQKPMPPAPGMTMSQALSQAYSPQMPMNPYLMDPSPGSGSIRPKKAGRPTANLPPIAPNMIPQQMGMASPQQQWYPQPMPPNRGYPNNGNQVPMMSMVNMTGMNGYGMRPPSNAPATRNKMQQGPNFYQQPQQFANPNQGYPQMQQQPAYPMQPNYRPQKMNQPPPMMSPQQQQLPMMPSPHMPNALYGGYPFQSGQELNRPGSSHSIASSRPGSVTSSQGRKIGKGGLPDHPSSFRTGMNASAKGGRRTPVDIRGTLTTQERYAKGSQASLGASEFDSYNLHDWRQLKSRDGSMRLPAGLGHTETAEWKDKVRSSSI